ncbi:MAG: N-acetyltransferase [Ferruginibacter sp.]
MNSSIRQEDTRDYERVDAIIKAAFGQENEALLVEVLRNTEAFIPELSLVAVQDEKPVGHILFSKILIRNSEGGVFESLALAPVAVVPELQRKGIGSALIRAGLAKARELGYTSVIVLGHPEYYPRFGFKPSVAWNIKAPFEAPENAFMAMELSEGALKDVSGIVQYPDGFALV